MSKCGAAVRVHCNVPPSLKCKTLLPIALQLPGLLPAVIADLRGRLQGSSARLELAARLPVRPAGPRPPSTMSQQALDELALLVVHNLPQALFVALVAFVVALVLKDFINGMARRPFLNPDKCGPHAAAAASFPPPAVPPPPAVARLLPALLCSLPAPTARPSRVPLPAPQVAAADAGGCEGVEPQHQALPLRAAAPGAGAGAAAGPAHLDQGHGRRGARRHAVRALLCYPRSRYAVTAALLAWLQVLARCHVLLPRGKHRCIKGHGGGGARRHAVRIRVHSFASMLLP